MRTEQNIRIQSDSPKIYVTVVTSEKIHSGDPFQGCVRLLLETENQPLFDGGWGLRQVEWLSEEEVKILFLKEICFCFLR
jgi:hypothetical protein